MSRQTETNESTSDAAAAPAGAPADAETEARIREAEERALRAQAEIQNLKRRQREEMERIQDTATKDLVVALLPIIDDLERALEAVPDPDDPLRAGVELTLSKLIAALGTVGVKRMDGVGAPFDPNLHEAIQQTPPDEDHPDGTISQVVRAGYTQHGHVVRAAMVAVAHQ